MLAYLVGAAVLVYGLLLRCRLTLPPELVAFVVLAAASTLWSVAPDLTLRRAFGLLGTKTVGLALAQRMSAMDLLDALRRTVVIVVLASLTLYLAGTSASAECRMMRQDALLTVLLVAALAVGREVGRDRHGDDWRGVRNDITSKPGRPVPAR